MLQRLLNLSGKARAGVAVAAGILVLLAVNWNIMQREHLLNDGKLVLLELAPVDPRSLMQGDYMALRFKITDQAFPNSRWGLSNGLRSDSESNFPLDGHLIVRERIIQVVAAEIHPGQQVFEVGERSIIFSRSEQISGF